MEGRSAGPGLPADVAFLAAFGVARHHLSQAAALAAQKGMAASEVLFARGWLARERYGEMLAAHTGIEHACAIEGQPSPATRERSGRTVLTSEPLLVLSEPDPRLAVAASFSDVANLLAATRGRRELLKGAVLMDPAVLRMKHLEFCRQAQAARASHALASMRPAFSAFGRVTLGQMATLLLASVLLIGLWLTVPAAAVIAAGSAMTVFYLASVLLRALMIWRLDTVPTDRLEAIQANTGRAGRLAAIFHLRRALPRSRTGPGAGQRA